MKVLMLAGNDESSWMVYHALKRKYNDIYIIVEKRVPYTVLLRRRIKKIGLKKVIGQINFKIFIEPLLKIKSKKRYADIIEQYDLDNTFVKENGRNVFGVETINDQKVIEIIKQVLPDVIIVNGTRIISEKVLNSTDTKFINMHAGITPKYRGVHGAYWALAEDDKENCGVTVHLVDAGIDTGEVIEQTVIRIKKEDNFCTYPLLQVAAGIPLELRAIESIENNDLKTKKVELPSKLWTHPTMGEYIKNYRWGVR